MATVESRWQWKDHKTVQKNKQGSFPSEVQNFHEDVARELVPLIDFDPTDSKPSHRCFRFALLQVKDEIQIPGQGIAAYIETLASALPNISPAASSLAVEYISQLCKTSATKVPVKT